jgi:hypothetical protein
VLKTANVGMSASKQNTQKCGLNEGICPSKHTHTKITVSEVVNVFEILFGSVQSILRGRLNMCCCTSVLCLVC